jgi:ABC-2 type transport system ATP-binding protein
MTVLTVDGVSRRYGDVVALDGVDLEVAEGTVLALLGPNGAGKTTLVGLASGQAAPDAGTVRVCGRDPRSGRTEDRRLVGLAPQDVALYPVLSVRDNLRAFGEMSGLGAREARRRAGELAEPFRLTHLLDRRAGQLSGGEQRRLHAAAALLHRPRLVLLDEPTAGADVQTRAAILDAVRGLTGDGTSVVYTTHYLPEIEQLDPEVAVIHRGRIVARGGLGQLVARHGDAAVTLDFDGPVPGDVSWPDGTVVDGSRVRVPCEEPGPALPALVAPLGSHAERLRSVELVRPSIEAVYLALTGSGADTADTAHAGDARDAVDTDAGDDSHPDGAARPGAAPGRPAGAAEPTVAASTTHEGRP